LPRNAPIRGQSYAKSVSRIVAEAAGELKC